MVVIINFKTYAQGTGNQGLKLAKQLANVSTKYPRVKVYLAVQNTDLFRISKSVKLPLLAQHVDPIDYGSHTGHSLVCAVKDAGAIGSLLNHSEKNIRAADINGGLSRLKDSGMMSVVCAKDLVTAKRYDKYGADYLAIEPPALIGGTTSVSSAKPGLIQKAASQLSTPLLVGAGVHSAQDVRVALKLGAKGILVASDILKAKDPKSELAELLSTF